MSHYGLLLDLAKMYDGRSRAIFSFQAITTTTATASVLLLLLLQQQQQLLATAMSLDRQALERNELPPAVAVDPISSSSSSSSSASLPFSSPELVVDDMKMTPLGNTDMYMLVPDPLASQVDNTEHVHRNTIEAEAEAEAQAEAESAADMLMLESEDTPSMHLVELPSDVAETQTETQAAELQTEAVPILKEEEVAASPELETEEHVVEQPVSKQEQEQEQQSQAENDETAPEPEPETDPEKEEKMELSTPAMIVEESKPELETAVENNDELEATESTVLASMSASSEEGISAVISELLPEELNIAQEDNQKQEQVQDHEAQEMIFQQPEEIETQTLAVLSDVETATEQQEQHLVALMPEAVVLADPIEEAPVEQVMPEETQSENEHETEADNPVETPVETPSDTPVEGPIEEPVESLAETPVETPIKTPVEALVDAPIETEQQAAPETGKPETSNDAEIMLPVKEVPSVPEQPEAVETAIAVEPESQKPAEILADEVHDAAVTQIEDQAEPQATVHTEILADELQQNQAEPEQSMLTTIIPMVVVPQQMQEEPQPLHVMDSVLNYVNGSFVQQEQQHDEGQQVAAVQTETTFNAQLRRYDGAQVWRIVVQTDKDKKLADELQSKYDGQLWKEVKQEVDYLLKPQVLAAAERHIRAANLSRIVLIDNLQQVIEVENPPAEKIAELQNRKGHRLTWQAYHRLEDIHGFIDYMAKTYPDICSTETIGHSVEKRPLKILKISNGNAQNPGIWIDGGMHAREWISPSTVTYIANQLVEGWEDLPEHMRNINWYIHPVANPDGYEYSHTTDRLWRKNMRAHGRQCPGVDLNRNFGYKWGGKGTSASPCSQTYRGSKAFSEPETFYISKFISGFPRETFQAYLSFHSYGQYILYPWGYDYHLTKDRADLDRVARQAGSIITKSSGVKYTVGSSATTLYPAAGGSDDWAKGIAGIKYAYTIEMGDTGRYGFVLPAQFIPYNGKDGYTFADTVARAVVQGRSQDARSSNSNRRRSR